MKSIVKLPILCMTIMGCCFLCACPSKEQKEQQQRQNISAQIAQPFNTTAKIHYQGVSALLTIDREAAGNYHIEFLEPEALSGITMQTQGDHITLSYKNISLDMSADEFFNSSAVKMLINTISSITADYGFTITMRDNQLLLDGTSENGNFTMVLDPANSNLLSLEIPSSGLEVEFENFAFLN